MAARVVCDGCGASQPEGEDFARVGYVRPADYCADCASAYRELEDRRDALHTSLASTWVAELAKLEAEFLSDHGRLPDR